MGTRSWRSSIPAGPACHTGERSCFFRDAETGATPEPAAHETLAGLERTLRARQDERPEGSYTVELLDDPALIGEKVREEAEEVTRAAREESDERVASEAADVLYHLSVLLRSRDVPLATSSRCSVTAAAESEPIVPVVERLIDDTETPVSAFLKLRAAFEGPAFLLESAEQGRLGRYSYLGSMPHRTLRWALGDDGDPYELAERLVASEAVAPFDPAHPFNGGAVGIFGYDLVRTVEPLGPPNPDPLGLPDMALMVCEPDARLRPSDARAL